MIAILVSLVLGTSAFAQEVPKAAPPTPEEIAATHSRYTDWAGGNACLQLAEDGTTEVVTIDACALLLRLDELEAKLKPVQGRGKMTVWFYDGGHQSEVERLLLLERQMQEVRDQLTKLLGTPRPAVVTQTTPPPVSPSKPPIDNGLIVEELVIPPPIPPDPDETPVSEDTGGLLSEIDERLKKLEDAVTALQNAPAPTMPTPQITNITNVEGGGTRLAVSLGGGYTRQVAIPGLMAPDMIHGNPGLTLQVGHADGHESEPFFAATGAPIIGTDLTLGGSGHVTFGYGFGPVELGVTAGGQGYGVRGWDQKGSQFVKARAFAPNAGLSVGFVLTEGVVLNGFASASLGRIETSNTVISDAVSVTGGASLTLFLFGN